MVLSTDYNILILQFLTCPFNISNMEKIFKPIILQHNDPKLFLVQAVNRHPNHKDWSRTTGRWTTFSCETCFCVGLLSPFVSVFKNPWPLTSIKIKAGLQRDVCMCGKVFCSFSLPKPECHYLYPDTVYYTTVEQSRNHRNIFILHLLLHCDSDHRNGCLQHQLAPPSWQHEQKKINVHLSTDEKFCVCDHTRHNTHTQSSV